MDSCQLLQLALGEAEAVHKGRGHGCTGAGRRKRAIFHLGRVECPQALPAIPCV